MVYDKQCMTRSTAYVQYSAQQIIQQLKESLNTNLSQHFQHKAEIQVFKAVLFQFFLSTKESLVRFHKLLCSGGQPAFICIKSSDSRISSIQVVSSLQ
jgi:uncharacterized membrane protein YheB (UPF0754 family)